MWKYVPILCGLLWSNTACQQQSAQRAGQVASPSVAIPAPTTSSPDSGTLTDPTAAAEQSTGTAAEKQYRFEAFMTQGDARFAAGDYRGALEFYRKAEATLPERADKAKMVACLKALQTPSTRSSKQSQRTGR
ncbi:MAG: hypothetical protein AAFW73_08885 [Bacteroidota bacterium]